MLTELASGVGGERVPAIAALVVSLASLSITGLGTLLGNRAQTKTTAAQVKADKVKAEQHMIEILQEETTRLRTDHAQDIARLREEHDEAIRNVREECVERVHTIKEQLILEREAHERTRHRYLEDMTALQLIVRDEVTKAAANLMNEDVRDLMRGQTPDQNRSSDADPDPS